MILLTIYYIMKTFRLTLINEYLKSLPKYIEIKIFYNVRYENPFNVKFPFICCLEDLDKRGKYLKEIEFLCRENVECYCDCNNCDCNGDGVGDCDCDDCLNCVCDDCDFCSCDCDCDVCDCGKLYYEGEPLIFKYHRLIKLLYKRKDVDYYKIKLKYSKISS